MTANNFLKHIHADTYTHTMRIYALETGASEGADNSDESTKVEEDATPVDACSSQPLAIVTVVGRYSKGARLGAVLYVSAASS